MSSTKGPVPGQHDPGRTQHLGQCLTFLDAADTPFARRVEPHVTEVQLEGPVGQQAAGTADVVVVDVGNNEQIDVTAAICFRRDRGQSSAKHRVGVVRPHVDQHAPSPLAHGALDEQAVAEGRRQDFETDGGPGHLSTLLQGRPCRYPDQRLSHRPARAGNEVNATASADSHAQPSPMAWIGA